MINLYEFLLIVIIACLIIGIIEYLVITLIIIAIRNLWRYINVVINSKNRR